MNYSEVLNPYQPLETGDFMYRYYINDQGVYNLFTGTKQDILFGVVRFQRS